jgi:hypothetical protein
MREGLDPAEAHVVGATVDAVDHCGAAMLCGLGGSTSEMESQRLAPRRPA